MKQEPETPPVIPPRPSRTSTIANRSYATKRPPSANRLDDEWQETTTPKKRPIKIEVKKEESR